MPVLAAFRPLLPSSIPATFTLILATVTAAMAPDLTDEELAWLALFLQASPAKRAALLRLATTLAELLPDGPPLNSCPRLPRVFALTRRPLWTHEAVFKRLEGSQHPVHFEAKLGDFRHSDAVIRGPRTALDRSEELRRFQAQSFEHPHESS